ncbi:hypothetical protein [Pinibacter soli]|uniref:Uncharacterized protein n=1 Tax=Pinibacter soli TaxID=3044211 RepID=A0ABT6RDU3_9BACT|nr:hypothetical protein [Pinibacter soli]MDI3320641.1 hypothetical protein [Pinibacter soli]
MRPYRYVIFKLYKWALRRPNDTPVFNVLFTLFITHFFQYATLVMVVQTRFGSRGHLLPANKAAILLGYLFFMLLFSLVMYNKKRWNGYLQEFENESEEDARNGTWFVLSYLNGSILLFFGVAILLVYFD